jgi:hypothetical protein
LAPRPQTSRLQTKLQTVTVMEGQAAGAEY